MHYHKCRRKTGTSWFLKTWEEFNTLFPSDCWITQSRFFKHNIIYKIYKTLVCVCTHTHSYRFSDYIYYIYYIYIIWKSIRMYIYIYIYIWVVAVTNKLLYICSLLHCFVAMNIAYGISYKWVAWNQIGFTYEFPKGKSLLLCVGGRRNWHVIVY